jgi:hypothetical protein
MEWPPPPPGLDRHRPPSAAASPNSDHAGAGNLNLIYLNRFFVELLLLASFVRLPFQLLLASCSPMLFMCCCCLLFASSCELLIE